MNTHYTLSVNASALGQGETTATKPGDPINRPETSSVFRSRSSTFFLQEQRRDVRLHGSLSLLLDGCRRQPVARFRHLCELHDYSRGETPDRGCSGPRFVAPNGREGDHGHVHFFHHPESPPSKRAQDCRVTVDLALGEQTQAAVRCDVCFHLQREGGGGRRAEKLDAVRPHLHVKQYLTLILILIISVCSHSFFCALFGEASPYYCTKYEVYHRQHLKMRIKNTSFFCEFF